MIETERLILRPLTYGQLVKYTKCDDSLEEELGLNKTSRTISFELKEAFEQTILPNVADTTKDYLYSTLWTAISKDANKMVGDICIVGEPNENGEIEIGYGIINWAKSQSKVYAIVASTEKENIGSFTILLKNNFAKISETETQYNWKLVLKSISSDNN